MILSKFMSSSTVNDCFQILRNFLARFDSIMSNAYVRAGICITIFFIFLLAYAPGGMSLDSNIQYHQALFGNFNRWHPPVMALVWRGFMFFHEGALPMICFHLLMLCLACFVLSGIPSNNGNRQWLWLFLPLLPQIYGNAGMIWKDIGMAFALFLSFSLYAKYLYTSRKIYLAVSILFCMYGILVRHNAIFAILPVLFLIFYWHFPNIYIYIYIYRERERERERRLWRICKIILFTGGTMLLVISFSYFFNHMVAPGPSGSPIRPIMIDEISVTSHKKGKNLFVESIPISNMSFDELPSYPVQKGWEFYLKVPQKYERELFKNWINIIYDHPTEYLNAKIDLFLHCISFPLKYKDAYAYNIINDCPETLHKSKFRSILEKPIKFCMEKRMFGIPVLRAFFLPIFWIPLGFVSFAVGIYRNDISGRLMALISSSGIFNFLSYLATPSTPDYRYFLWSFLAIIISFGLWLYAPKCVKVRARKE